MHENEAFVNFNGSAIRAGVCPEGATCMESAETLYRNCMFANSTYGVTLAQFNDYDHTFDGCHFQDHQIAINSFHGIVYVRNTRFERSNVTDIVTGTGDQANVHRSVSIGSKTFLQTPGSEFDCNVKVYNVAVFDFWGPAAIETDCPGPFVFLDSSFESRNKTDASIRAWFANGNPSLSVATIVAGNNVLNGKALSGDEGIGYENNSIKDLLLTSLPAAGKEPPMRITSETKFFRSNWPDVYTKVFDAVRDFGANCTAGDCTDAVGATISAAAGAGNNAAAY
jgi:hypothetical protein